VANKVVGPAFREIGARYGKEPDAEGRLAARVKAGGAGNWGSVPMPAQAHVPDADVKAILRWILAGST
jgi:cytochrome c